MEKLQNNYLRTYVSVIYLLGVGVGDGVGIGIGLGVGAAKYQNKEIIMSSIVCLVFIGFV